MQKHLFDRITAFLSGRHYTVADGVIDGIYTAQTTDGLLVLNTHLAARTKQVTLPSGDRRALALEPNSITRVTD